MQTVDFFPPVVDDPYTFGAVAAANAMSDVYAMGGEVLLALQVAGFPEDQPEEVLAEIFRGGGEKVAEAGGVIAGGHTLFDEEPKYGLAVTGTANPNELVESGKFNAVLEQIDIFGVKANSSEVLLNGHPVHYHFDEGIQVRKRKKILCMREDRTDTIFLPFFWNR